MIPARLGTNPLLFSFCLFLETKKRTEVSPSWWPDYEKYFHFLFKMSCALLQIDVEFNSFL